MRQDPIGVFDSGLGGLTAVKELRCILPGEDIVYFGDTGRVPYGAKDSKTIIRYARQDIDFLLSQNVKTVLAACGTVSSTFPAEEGDRLPVPYTGVVGAAAAAAVKATRNGRVGILGTETTIASGSYQRQLAALSSDIFTVAGACPLFVPLVEYGYSGVDNPMANLAAEEYLAPIKAAGVDTVIMGCTHYPLLREVVGKHLGAGVTLVDSGREAALALRGTLAQKGLLAEKNEGGQVRYYVSDDPDRFGHYARLFLGEDAECDAVKIDIDMYGQGE